MESKHILIAKTKTVSYGMLNHEWEWIKYSTPTHYDFITAERAEQYIRDRNLEEVARSKYAVLYDSPDREFYNAYKGYFSAKSKRDAVLQEAQALAKLKNRL